MTFSFNVRGLTPQDAQTGGGGTTPTPIPTLDPAKAAGICFWIDGQYNTRAGKDNTKTYLENLCWNNIQSNVDGNLEYFTNTNQNVWDGDYLKLGTYAYYPWVFNQNVTLEATIKISETQHAARMVFSTAYRSGFYLQINSANKVVFGFRQGDKYINITSDIELEYNKPYYIGATLDTHSNKAVLNVFSIDKNEKKTTVIESALVNATGANSGVGTQAMSGTAMNGERWDGLSIGMIRCWNRALTDSEIQENYEDCKKRFNF